MNKGYISLIKNKLMPFSSSYRLTIFSTFFEMGSPSICIKMMHTTFFYFIYSTKAGKKPYNSLTNGATKSNTKVVQPQEAKHMALCPDHREC
jgi:hypothetical protein